MRNFLLRVIVNAIALAATAYLLPGIEVKDNSIGTLLIVGFIFGVINAIVKPIIIILSCPLVLLSLGLFLLVINGLMLLITEELAGGRLTIDGFWWAVLGGIVMGLIGMVLESALGIKDDEEEKENEKD
ncbi:MAG: phage holin family protein [Anaerolineae bacterium]|nr:phage holin family protein [Anaerolineae bacterium]